MKFYEFDQNNSGGGFVIDEEVGIGPRVWIQAFDANEANVIAERLGLYFDGVDDDMDCECCGDRWLEASEYDGEDVLNLNEYDGGIWGPAFVHYADGTFKKIIKGVIL